MTPDLEPVLQNGRTRHAGVPCNPHPGPTRSPGVTASGRSVAGPCIPRSAPRTESAILHNGFQVRWAAITPGPMVPFLHKLLHNSRLRHSGRIAE